MKRLIVIMLALSLTSCAYIGATEDILVSSPATDSTTSLSSVGIVSEPSVSGVVQQGTASLLLNKNSKKIHYYDTCSYAKNMKEENKSFVPFEQLEALLGNGYSVCSWCEKQYLKENG